MGVLSKLLTGHTDIIQAKCVKDKCEKGTIFEFLVNFKLFVPKIRSPLDKNGRMVYTINS